MSVQFNAAGRWSYGNNLEQIGVWTSQSHSEKVRAAYAELCRELAKRVAEDGLPGAWIRVYYKEDERGCQILRECEGEVNLNNGALTGFVTNTEDYEYTAENLVSLGFYDSIEDIDFDDDYDE